MSRDLNRFDLPLHRYARLLRKGPPSYLKCDSNVFPAWTKASARFTVTMADRPSIPSLANVPTLEFVRAFEEQNHHVPTDWILNA